MFKFSSPISKINRSFPDEIEVGDDIYSILKQSMSFSQMTKGAFDITVGPLISLWKDAQALQRMPEDKQIQNVLGHVGSKKIKFEAGQRIRLLDPKTRIDLGGITVGYAVDEVVEILRSKGFNDFLIDAGGYICKWHKLSG